MWTEACRKHTRWGVRALINSSPIYVPPFNWIFLCGPETMDMNHTSQSALIAKRRLLPLTHVRGGQGLRGGRDLCLRGKTWPWVSAPCQQHLFHYLEDSCALYFSQGSLSRSRPTNPSDSGPCLQLHRRTRASLNLKGSSVKMGAIVCQKPTILLPGPNKAHILDLVRISNLIIKLKQILEKQSSAAAATRLYQTGTKHIDGSFNWAFKCLVRKMLLRDRQQYTIFLLTWMYLQQLIWGVNNKRYSTESHWEHGLLVTKRPRCL